MFKFWDSNVKVVPVKLFTLMLFILPETVAVTNADIPNAFPPSWGIFILAVAGPAPVVAKPAIKLNNVFGVAKLALYFVPLIWLAWEEFT